MSPGMARAPAASAVASVDSERATAATAQPSARRRSMTRPAEVARAEDEGAALLLRVVHAMQHDGRDRRPRSRRARARRHCCCERAPAQAPASSRAWWPATSTSSPSSSDARRRADRARRPRRAPAAGPARLTFNAPSAACCSPAPSRVDERETRFWPNAKGAELRAAARGLPRRGRPARDDRAAGQRLVACTTLNLSIGGALLETEAPFAPPYELTVAIDCGGAEPVSLAATPIRSERQATRHAVAFANVGGADERALSTLIATAQRRGAGHAVRHATYVAVTPRLLHHQDPIRMTPWTAIAVLPFVASDAQARLHPGPDRWAATPGGAPKAADDLSPRRARARARSAGRSRRAGARRWRRARAGRRRSRP